MDKPENPIHSQESSPLAVISAGKSIADLLKANSL